MSYYAHTKNDPVTKEPLLEEHWEPLFTLFGDGEDECRKETCKRCEALAPKHGHLNKVAYWTAKFAAEMFPPNSAEANAAQEWGYLAGLWHDLGKYRKGFQSKICGEQIQVEHAGAGATLASKLFEEKYPQSIGKFTIPAIIAGHHAGLSNKTGQGDGKLTPLIRRVENNQEALSESLKNAEWSADHPDHVPDLMPLMEVSDDADIEPSFYRASFFTRMLFSCLVDADSIATEAFTNPTTLRKSLRYDSIEDLRDRLDQRLDEFATESQAKTPSVVNSIRADILTHARSAANESPGVFSLNVPTGGGKTLSGMSFALRHAAKHALRRVIVVIPYTSIIEQNAQEYAEFLGDRNVLEHHSNLDDFDDIERGDPDATRRRLCTENWDAPVIVTTTVQFFESLFANKKARNRKIHNIAQSVIILDEAQCLPAPYLKVTLLAMRELVESCGCSIVLSTATQPALHQRSALQEGFPLITPIISSDDAMRYHSQLTDGRCQVDWSMCQSPVPYSAMAARIADQRQGSLTIVHRRKDAVDLNELVKSTLADEGESIPLYYLTTLMCPLHRKEVLTSIKQLRKARKPCHIVSTQLVEAGVNLDLPVVFRVLAGFDSIAQAAGRCNREGLMPTPGKVFVFKAETDPPDAHLVRCADTTATLLGLRGALRLGDLEASREFFERLYANTHLDQAGILKDIPAFNFETIARNYRIIEDGFQTPLVIPYNDDAKEKIRKVQDQATHSDNLSRHLLRSLQPYTVNVWDWDFKLIVDATERLFPDAESYMANLRLFPDIYSDDLGLVIPDKPPQPSVDGLILGN